MSYIEVNSTSLPSELAQILDANQVQVGSQVSYQLCKLLWEYHPLAGKIIEKPIRLALSKTRKINIPCGIEDQLKEAFQREWDRLGATNHIRDTMYLSRVYGAAAIVFGAPNVPTDEPIDPWKLSDLQDIYFNQLDPLNLAGSIVTNQNPNAPDFQKPNQSITAAGQPYHPSRSCTVFCGTPIYLSFQGSSFSFSGRSLFLRALYPLKSFIQTMTVDDLVSLKAGLLIAKIQQSGSIVNRLMQSAATGKRDLLKEGQTGNVLSITPEESIESIDLNNTDKAMTTARNNIIANIAAACDVPAILLKDEAYTQGFGEGTEDAKAVAQYIEALRHDMATLFDYFDNIVQHRAWNVEFYQALCNEHPDEVGSMTYEAFFYYAQGLFKAEWPTLIEEPESEKIRRDSDKLKAMSDVIKTLGDMLDPENKARAVAWFTDNLNAMTELFVAPMDLDIEALAQYEPPQPAAGGFPNGEGEDGQQPQEQQEQQPEPKQEKKPKVEAKTDADWQESDHPRDEGGKFTSGGGSASGKQTEDTKVSSKPTKQVKLPKSKQELKKIPFATQENMPKVGEPFMVARVSSKGHSSLDNTNAGDVDAIVNFLAFLDDYDKPAPADSEKSDTVYISAVVVNKEFGQYSRASRGKLLDNQENAVGISTEERNFWGVTYSFPEHGEAYESETVLEIPISELREELKKHGASSFEYFGTRKNAEIFKDVLNRKMEESGSVSSANDADWQESKHPRDDKGRFTSGGGGGGSSGETTGVSAAQTSNEPQAQQQAQQPKMGGLVKPEQKQKAVKPVPQSIANISSEQWSKEDQAEAYREISSKFDRTLNEKQKGIEDRLAKQIAGNFGQAVADYAQLEDAEGGKVLNTDVARELSPDYDADRTQAAAVHEPASWFIKQLYAQMLKQQPSEGEDPVVMFTGGGTGAGKSSAIKNLPELEQTKTRSQIVYDTNMANARKAIEKIDMALAAGKSVSISYVHRDPVESLALGALTRAMSQERKFGTGRTVPLGVHLTTHIEANQAIREIAEHYKDNKRVDINIIDNTRGKGNATKISIAELPVLTYDQFEEKINATLERERSEGRISEAVYRGFRGDEAPLAKRVETGGSGQPEQKSGQETAGKEVDEKSGQGGK